MRTPNPIPALQCGLHVMEDLHSIFEHPKFKELDCSTIKNKCQMRTAFTVFLDLCEVKEWWNLHLHPCQELDLIFLSGHSARHEPRELILPMLASENVTLEILQMYLSVIKLDDYETKGLTLAICDTDSTIVYYKINDGLVKPSPPEVTDALKQQKVAKYRKRRMNVLAAVDQFYEDKKSKYLESDKNNRTEDSKYETESNTNSDCEDETDLCEGL